MSYPATLTPSLHHPTLNQWFGNSFVRILATSDSLGWNNIIVRSTEIDATPDYVILPHIDDDTLVFSWEGSPHVEGHLADGHTFRTHMSPGAIAICPRWFESDMRLDSFVKSIYVHVSRPLISDLALSVLRGDPERIEILPNFGFFDPLLLHLSTELYHELQNGSLFGPLFAESVANMITLHLLRKYSNASTVRDVSGGKLTPIQLRIVNEYIHAHLHEKISLADLATCIHVSVPHFEKMFRATIHCSPYHYVLERRIERAKVLLCGTQLSLYDVARDCGFANQSHFTKHFTKMVGVSPARFMRGVRR